MFWSQLDTCYAMNYPFSDFVATLSRQVATSPDSSKSARKPAIRGVGSIRNAFLNSSPTLEKF